MGRIFGAASFVVLGLGIWLVADRDHTSFGDTWVVLSLAPTSVLVLMGPLLFARKSKAVVHEGIEKGGDHPDPQRRARMVLRVARSTP